MYREELPIRFPCPDSNKQLSAVPGQLYCATCDRDVIELDRLTGAEVRDLKRRAGAGERICVRYRVDPEGLIQLRRSPPMRPLRAAAAAAGLVSLFAVGAAHADATVPPAPGKKPCAAGKKDPASAQRASAVPEKPDPKGSKATPVKAAKAAAVIYDVIDGGI